MVNPAGKATTGLHHRARRQSHPFGRRRKPVFHAIVASGLSLSVDPRHTCPCVYTHGAHRHSDSLHKYGPRIFLAILLYVYHKRLRSIELRTGRQRRRVLRAHRPELGSHYLDRRKISRFAHIHHHSAAGHVDHCLAHLPDDLEITLYGLVAHYAPLPVLIETQRHRQRIRQVNRLKQWIIHHCGSGRDTIARYPHGRYIDFFGKCDGCGAGGTVYHSSCILPVGFQCQKISLYAGIGYIVVYTRTQHCRQYCHCGKS